MSTTLDWIDLSTLLDMYSDPVSGSLDQIAAAFGVSHDTVYCRLTSDADRYNRALEVKAQRLHDLSIAMIHAEPSMIANGIYGDRIDPASVALMKYKHDALMRTAGLLSQRLSERNSRLDVTVDASPLSDMIQRIAASGSTIPIATCAPLPAIEGEFEAVESSDT